MPTPLRRVYDNVRTGQTVLRDAGRLREILTVLARHGFGAFVQALRLQERWLPGKLLDLRAEPLEAMPVERRLLLAVQDLGPTFVKLGQMASTRPDLFPAPLIAELSTLQDRVPPLPLEAVRGVIREELGAEVEEHFTDFSPEPLASASIAQVHRASLADGRAVVVKVQRPDLRPRIEADLEIMGFLARQLEANFPETRLFSPVGMVAEFERAILKEIDFTTELGHLERFRRNFAEQPKVRFPTPYRELSTARVLTMEFMPGVKITEVGPGLVDVETVVDTVLEAVLQMIYTDGFFHGDLHPGNLLVRDDGTVCFIDVGLCGRLTPRQRDLLTDLLVAVARQDFDTVARLLWRMTIHGKESTRDYATFAADLVECAEGWFSGKTMAQVEFGRVLADLIAVCMRHRVRLPADYTMTFKAVITVEGVGKQIHPDLDLLTAAQPYAARLIAARYQPERMLETGYTLARDLAETMGSVPETALAILEDVRAGRAQLGVESPQLDAWRRTYAHAQQRLVVALLAIAAALCGTLALPHGAGLLLGLPGVALAFYGAALLLTLWCLALGRAR